MLRRLDANWLNELHLPSDISIMKSSLSSRPIMEFACRVLAYDQICPVKDKPVKVPGGGRVAE